MKTFRVPFRDLLKVTPNGQPGMGMLEVHLEADGYEIHQSGALMFYRNQTVEVRAHPEIRTSADRTIKKRNYFMTIPPGAWGPVIDMAADAVRLPE